MIHLYFLSFLCNDFFKFQSVCSLFRAAMMANKHIYTSLKHTSLIKKHGP